MTASALAESQEREQRTRAGATMSGMPHTPMGPHAMCSVVR